MDTKTIIGFGGTFYTLWYVSSQMHYYTAPNGKHYPSYMEYQYSYIQNISKDIERVQSLYPGISIDMELKGTRSFTIEKKDIDLTPEILKFGKYAGHDIRELVKTDLDYILYMMDSWYNKAWEIAKQTPEYLAYVDKQNHALEAKIATFKPFSNGKHRLTIQSNPDENGIVCVPIIDGQSIELHFNNIKECYYNGYTYYLPVFKDGKAKRLKGKDIEYQLEIIETDLNTEHGYCFQSANVLN